MEIRLLETKTSTLREFGSYCSLTITISYLKLIFSLVMQLEFFQCKDQLLRCLTKMLH